jgi:Flp pilus assembly protein TadG
VNLGSVYHSLCVSAKAKLRRFARDNRANVAMMFGLSMVPLLIATGAGIDFARGVMVHQRMGQALDAAALAVGNATSKPSSCTANGASTSTNACYALRQVAQQYFDMSYDHTQDATYGTPAAVAISISGQAVTLSSTLPLQLTLLGITPIGITSPTVTASSTVVWGQTKLWVALVLDNSGSMDNGDSSGSKMDALKDALNNTTYGLLKTLKNAAANEGDVKVGIVPFANTVRPGFSSTSSYLDWAEWDAPPIVVGTSPDSHNVMGFTSYAPDAGVPLSAFGPGDDCPFTDSSNNLRNAYGFYCATSETNTTSKTSTIASSGSRTGYICPGRDYGTNTTQSHNGHYYNGCWTSTKVNGQTVAVTKKSSSAACTGFSGSNCSCSGSGSNKQCFTQKWTHAWFSISHSNWTSCVTDRQRINQQTMTLSGPRTAAAKDYDSSKDAPGSGDTLFPAANPSTCVASAVVPFPATWSSSQWTTLSTTVTNMDAGGSTNQAIGVAHGWHMLTPGAPYGSPSVPDGTTRVLILFTDGLNTQNRWWGDGSTEGTTEDGYIDTRTAAVCTAAKNDGIVIYSMWLHVGSNGDPTTLQNCASSPDKYYDLTASSQVKDAFKDIAQKITNLRVSQ